MGLAAEKADRSEDMLGGTVKGLVGPARSHPGRGRERPPRPAPCAALVAFLVGPSTSFIMGQSVHVDDGRLFH
ncbi:hypothetical protein [Streptomyces erythrochromogenes]|uniref:hypothetical protein n=1 Tax=Streptomyces erythrochromogenes TaxID=285574 RepID=UPI003700E894